MNFCAIDPASPGEHETPSTVNLALTATTSPVKVGGYSVVTQNYNGTYLPPVIELGAGDRLKVHLLNALSETSHAEAGGMAAHALNSNLHTHGLIVPPKNATDPARGNGDNVFVSLARGEWLDYDISIPVRLPASVLDGKVGFIPHPEGPYWYHSHLHGVSQTQVSGGMSSMMSIGERKANVVASGIDPDDTLELRNRTDAHYLLLRDIKLRSAIPPLEAHGNASAEWVHTTGENPCYPPNVEADTLPTGADRKGYCLNPNDPPSLAMAAPAPGAAPTANIWLFTVNGQRYPTITVARGKNALLRVGNLSSDVTYVLSLVKEGTSNELLPFNLLSVDGVVPARPQTLADLAGAGGLQAKSIEATQLTLMPAARAEIYLRNDGGSTGTGFAAGTYILRTAEQCTNALPSTGQLQGQCKPNLAKDAEDKAKGDHFPQIDLARLVLMDAATPAARPLLVSLNQPIIEARWESAASEDAGMPFAPATDSPAPLPQGCVRDIDKSAGEFRRITFGNPNAGRWQVSTEIVKAPLAPTSPAPAGVQLKDPKDLDPVDEPENNLLSVPFEKYLDGNGTVDWEASNKRPKHPCIRYSGPSPEGSGYGQLWELKNQSQELHNFHIHQMKFRLATRSELESYGIDPDKTFLGTRSESLQGTFLPERDDVGATWHDTLPLPRNTSVFVVMNFVAAAQIGKFVYHCHILEHEDAGLMAPMEVVR